MQLISNLTGRVIARAQVLLDMKLESCAMAYFKMLAGSVSCTETWQIIEHVIISLIEVVENVCQVDKSNWWITEQN